MNHETVLTLPIPTEIETERMMLRIPAAGMGITLNAALNSTIDSLKPFMPWMQTLHTVEQDEAWCRGAVASFYRREEISYHMWHKADNVLIGTVGLHRAAWDVPWLEAGYWLHHKWEKQGLMHEAVTAVMQMTIDVIGVRRLELRCDTRNHASANVARKAGFTLVGTFHRDTLGVDGLPRDTHVFEYLPPQEQS